MKKKDVETTRASLALRHSLDSPFPRLRLMAIGLIREASREGTIKEQRERLKLSKRAYERLRADFVAEFYDYKKE